MSDSSQNLKITIIQSDLSWENKEANCAMFTQKINAISEDTDVIVLPEMFNTGFSMNASVLAEDSSGYTLNWMAEMAMNKNAVVTGSLIIQENGRYYNRLIWMNPDGTFSQYDKRHLFSMGSEDRHYTAGKSSLVVNYKGWKIMPVVCYDLRFPAWLRNHHEAYDVLIVIANWPDKRISHWDVLLPARAIENQVYVVGVNRVGTDGNGLLHTGHSAIYSAYGDRLFFSEQEENKTVELDAHHLKLIRRQYPFLRDADEFTIHTK